MAVIVSDLISRALNLAGRLGPGRTAGASEKASAFLRLNEMLDAWAAERLMIYKIVPATHVLVAAQQVYTIGPGAADFNLPRPMRIDEASIIYCSIRYPLELLTPAGWSAVRDSDIAETALTGVIPRKMWNDQASPISNLYLWPIPSTNNTLLETFTWEPITQFGATSDTVTLPPAYLEALRFNLAVSFAAEIGKGVAPQVAAQAAESKRNIQISNKALFTEDVKKTEIEALESASIASQVPKQSAPPSSGQGNLANG